MQLEQPLNEYQLEILKSFESIHSKEKLLSFKSYLRDFLIKEFDEKVNEIWESNKFNNEWVDDMLNTKLRKH